jgi:hypothetical protein
MSAQQCFDSTVLKCALCSFSRDEMSVSDCWQRRLKFFVLFRWPIRVQVLLNYPNSHGSITI